jgi:hypothetical protein
MRSLEKSPRFVPAARCPYCHEDVARGRPAYVCPECHALHHKPCAREADECASCGEPIRIERPREPALVYQRPLKEPWLALLLTLIAPGLGHVYAGAVGFGVTIFFTFGLICLAFLFILPIPLSLIAILALEIWLVINAYGCADRANAEAYPRPSRGSRPSMDVRSRTKRR